MHVLWTIYVALFDDCIQGYLLYKPLLELGEGVCLVDLQNVPSWFKFRSGSRRILEHFALDVFRM